MRAGAPDLLILSGTYVGPDLTAEFGRLPPSFLPLGAKRVLEAQLEFAEARGLAPTLTLPQDWPLSALDAEMLEARGVRTVRLPAELSLNRALLAALEAMGAEERLVLLFGDTLAEHAADPDESDFFVTGTTRHFARWAEFTLEPDGAVSFREGLPEDGRDREVVCGLFDFADAAALRAALAAEATFTGALGAYAAGRRFRPEPAVTWLDFGHLHTYFQSRRERLAARAFNNLAVTEASVRKAGSPARKIHAEAEWYRALPAPLRIYAPQLLGVSTEPEVAYEVEYLHLSAVSELYCFSDLPRQTWRMILRSCQVFLELCQAQTPRPHEVPAGFERTFFEDMVAGKTLERLEAFAAAEGLDLSRPWTIDGRPAPSLAELAETLTALVGPTRGPDICLWHGDFHFANVFFDFRAQRIRCVDARGLLSSGALSLYGDARYDIAKLSHSVTGLYDFLIAGAFRLQAQPYDLSLEFCLPERIGLIQADFLELKIGAYRTASAGIRALTALLFLAMLPLHAEDRTRQYAMLANAYRLWRELEAAA